MYYIIHAITLERFHIVAHSFAASFSIKTSFMKLTSYFISKTKQIYAKTLTVLESTFKMRAKLPWMLFEIWLCQQLFAKKDFCTKTRLCNIFKTTNIKTLIKFILESPYKLLQIPCKTTALRQYKYFSQVVQF